MPTLKLNHLDLAYTIDPPAKPARGTVLLIHGLGCQLIQWPQPMLEDLAAAGFQVLRFDNRDVGASRLHDAPRPYRHTTADLLRWRLGARLPAHYGLEHMADDAVALLDALNIGQIHVVGVSMGGMIAQELALRHASRVLSQTLIMTTSGRRGVGQPRREVMRALMRPPASRAPEQVVEHLVSQWRLLEGPAYPGDDEERRTTARACLARGLNGAGFARQMQAIMNAPNRERRLARLRVPTLVVHGTADPLVHVSGGKALARAIPNVRLELIEGWGHDWPASVVRRLSGLLLTHLDAQVAR